MENIMTKTNGLVLAAFLMASTSPAAFGQTATPGAGTGTGTTTETTPGTGTTTPGSTGSTGTTTPGAGDTTTPGATGTTTPGASGTAGASGSLSGSAAVDGMQNSALITSLNLSANTEQDWDTEFGNLSSDSDVRIVTLSELRESDDAGAPMLDQTMQDLEDRQSDLRTAIEGNDTLRAALEDEGYSAEDVVAAVVQPGTENEVTLVVDTERAAD
jgi:hypothetical protein